MGRKKKQFIDKKNAVTFNLVHRSQKDPLIDDTEESQMVLVAQATPMSHDDHLTEQQKYGIDYNDDYDYLQHLKEQSSVYHVTMETKTKKHLHLPSELFGAEVTTKGAELTKVTPLIGPQLDWDPDIIESLDRVENSQSDDETLEDDFVLLANGGEPDLPVYVRKDMEIVGESLEPWWLARGGYNYENQQSDDNCSDQSNESISDTEGYGMKHRTAKFTEYSMTSSIVPRSEGLTNLDDRFEEFMEGYSDDQIGPLEEVGCDGHRGGDIERILLDTAVQDFITKYKHTRESLAGLEVNVKIENEVKDEEEEVSGDEYQEVIPIGTPTKWDCESILSTYSNIYNHPTFIKDPPRIDKIILSDKTELPLTSKDCKEPSHSQSIVSKVNTVRPKNEGKDERHIRKQAIKEERRIRRKEKKILKITYKKEELRQEQELIRNPPFKSIC